MSEKPYCQGISHTPLSQSKLLIPPRTREPSDMIFEQSPQKNIVFIVRFNNMSTRTSLKAASLLTQVTFLSISSILYVSSNPAQAANLTCPPPAQTPKDGDANGDGKPDWFLEEQIDAKGNKVQIWCLDKAGGQFGQRYVPKNGNPVWAGACLFVGGVNRQSKCKNPITGEWEKLDWLNVDDNTDDDPATQGRDDWFWLYDIPQNKLLTVKTLNGRPVNQRISPPPENFGDITFGNSQLSSDNSNSLSMVVDPVITLVNISAGSIWEYGLLTPPGYIDRISDQSLMVTDVKAGDSLFIKGSGITNPVVTKRASLPEFGAWEFTFLADDFVTFTATQNATIEPDTLIDGFQFFSPNPAGQIQWITNGEEICFTDTIFGPTPVPEPTSTISFLALGTLGAASTLKRKLKPSKSSEKETTKVS